MKYKRIALLLVFVLTLVLPILGLQEDATSSDGIETLTIQEDTIIEDPDIYTRRMPSRLDRKGKPPNGPQDKRFTSQIMASQVMSQQSMVPPIMMQPPVQPPSYYQPPPSYYQPPPPPMYQPMQPSFWPGYYYYDGFDMIMLRNGRKKSD